MAKTPVSDPSFLSLLKELPQEIFMIVLKHLRNISSSSSFLSYLLACRRWCDLGLRLLYNVIIFKNSNLRSFLTLFSPANLFLIKSFTIRIDIVCPKVNSTTNKYEEDREEMIDKGSSKFRTLWDRLKRLVKMISGMNALLVCSFVVAPHPSTQPGFWIPSSIIASMIENLPRNCVNLEIDAAEKEYSFFQPVHLCDTIRAVLSRLQHLRVRLYRICPMIFCTEVDENEIINRNSVASSTSFLKTVIIHCDLPYAHDQWARTSRVCGPFDIPISNADRFVRSKSRRSLIAALRNFWLCGKYPEIERLWLIDSQRDEPCQYEAYFRRDILLDKTWVIPRLRITMSWSAVEGSRRNSILKEDLLTRTPEGHDVLSSRSGAENAAEAHTWQETVGGCRIPALMTATEHLQREVLPFESEQAYKLRCPEISFSLWVNEEKTGQRLLHAFESQGLIHSPDVNEITPNGWIRNGNNWRLEPEPEN